jgi:hypothetical protein
MPLLILRPLITAIIEYLLAYRVFKKGHILPIATSLFLISLATYQFGEYLFLSQNDRTWFAISLFATTMLPPYGLLLVEKLSHKHTFYILFLIASALFGLTFILVPSVVPGANECNCFAKIDSSTLVGWEKIFFTNWGIYYFSSLALTMVLMLWHIFRKNGDTKNLTLLLIGYFSFFPFSYFVIHFWGVNGGLIASVMCALAIICAFIVTHISESNPSLKLKTTKKIRRVAKRI